MTVTLINHGHVQCQGKRWKQGSTVIQYRFLSVLFFLTIFNFSLAFRDRHQDEEKGIDLDSGKNPFQHVVNAEKIEEETCKAGENEKKAQENPSSNCINCQLLSAFEEANLTYENGDVEKAIQLYEALLDQMRRLSIVTPKMVFLVLQELWKAQMDLQRHDDALVTAQRLLKVDELLHGKNDPRSLNTLFQSSKTYLLVVPRRTKEAIDLLEKVKYLFDQGDLHNTYNLDRPCSDNLDSMWADTYFNLAVLYYEQGGKRSEVKDLFMEIWRRLKRTRMDGAKIPDPDPQRFQNLDNKASWSAVTVARIMLDEMREVNNRKSPIVKAKMLEDAVNLCREAFQFMKSIYGEDNEYTQKAYRCLKEIFRDQTDKIKDTLERIKFRPSVNPK